MKILFVDNDDEFLKVRSECLQYARYDVVAVTTAEQARAVLESDSCDIMIIDVRLKDDNDEKDRTGLWLAIEVDTRIPKIILTGYPNSDLVTEVLRQRPDGSQLAWDFVAKEEDPEMLLEAVRKVGMALAKL